MDSSLQTRLQTTLGESYLIESELSPGGMSRLFLATERALQRKVVVKLLPPEYASELNAQRFQREMLVTARLQHAHIVPVLSAGARDGLLYYITPYVAGESLRHRLVRERALPVTDAVRLLREVAEALAFAHGQGVIHRDLKPGNILLQHGHAVLADFGIARALAQASRDGMTDRLTTTGFGLGTPGYMAPEQLAGDSDVDERADIYAFGVVAYEVLAGERPFAGSAPAKLLVSQMTEDPEHLTARAPTVPRPLADMVMQCLKRDPEDRCATADQILACLDELVADEQTPRTLRPLPADPVDASIRSGINAYNAGEWHEAYDTLYAANEQRELSPDNLEMLADAAWWVGRVDDALKFRERAYVRQLERGNLRRAAGVALLLAEDHHHRLARSVSRGWMQRAERHLAGLPESIEHGWYTRTRMALDDGLTLEQARELAQQTLDIARRLGDRDLATLALQDQGRLLVAEGRVAEGMALIDEAMTAATSGQLDARTTGRTYCNMMSTCEKIGDYRRAGEWNAVANRWTEPHKDSAYPGICRVHRAELLRLRGDWPQAEAEARRAAEELEGFLADVVAEAHYELGEVRLRMGDFAATEEAFRRAHELGRDPMPGLARLRLAQGRAESAMSLMKRALAEPGLAKLDRARLLPTYADAAIATGELDAARAATEAMDAIAAAYDTPALLASALLVRGSVSLAEQRAGDAAVDLRRAWRLWKELDLPYEAARTRVLLSRAYELAGNTEDATLELQAAVSSFTRLGAVADASAASALLNA